MIHKCPDENTLRKILDGVHNPDEAIRIEGHLEECKLCQRRMEQLADEPLSEEQRQLYRVILTRDTPIPTPVIPEITLLEAIGQGSSGQVWKGQINATEQLVAVKLIADGTQINPEHVTRFRREIDILSRLSHPNLIRLYHAGVTSNGHYFSMEYMPQGSINDLRRRNIQEDRATLWPIRKTLKVMVGVARAIQHTHDAQILHRDLKPGNILLDEDHNPKVADFSLGKILVGQDTTVGVGGTPCYMAPEQAAGQAVNERTDVYGLGATLYDLLTERPPIAPGESDLEVLARIDRSNPVPVRDLRPDVPKDLERVCLKALEKRPNDRYASAADFADELQRILDGKPVLARPISVPGRVYRWSRRHPTVAALSMMLIVVIIASLVTTTWLWQDAVTSKQQAIARKEQVEEEQRENQKLLLTFADSADVIFRNPSLLSIEERKEFINTFLQVLNQLDHADIDPERRHEFAWAALRLAKAFINIDEFDAALRTVDVAIGHYKQLIERNPDPLGMTQKRMTQDLVDGLTIKAHVYKRKHQDEQAEQHYRQALSLAEQGTKNWPESDHGQTVLASVQVNLGELLIEQGSYTEAEKHLNDALILLKRLIEKFPTDWSRHGSLRSCYERLGQVYLARDQDVVAFSKIYDEWYNRVLDVRKHHTDWIRLTQPWGIWYPTLFILENIGHGKLSAKKIMLWLPLLRSAANDEGSMPRIELPKLLGWHAKMCWEFDKPTAKRHCREAIQLFEKVMDQSPTTREIGIYVAFLNQCPDPNQRNPTRAIELGQQAIRLDPEDLPSHSVLMQAYLTAEKYNQAIEIANQWFPWNDSNNQYYYPHMKVALARYQLGMVQEAQTEMKGASAYMLRHQNISKMSWQFHDKAWREIFQEEPPSRDSPNINK